MSYGTQFDRLQHIADYRSNCKSLRQSARGGILVGVVFLLLGLLEFQNRLVDFSRLGVAVSVLLIGLVNYRRPSAIGVVLDGVMILLCGALNLTAGLGWVVAVLDVAAIFHGIRRILGYGHAREVFRDAPTAGQIAWFDDLVDEIQFAETAADPDAVEFMSGPRWLMRRVLDLIIWYDAKVAKIIGKRAVQASKKIGFKSGLPGLLWKGKRFGELAVFVNTLDSECLVVNCRNIEIEGVRTVLRWRLCQARIRIGRQTFPFAELPIETLATLESWRRRVKASAQAIYVGTEVLKPSLFAACLLAAVISAPAADPPSSKATNVPIAGLWEGPLKAGVSELRLGFRITTKPDGSLTGTLDSIDQGAKDIPIETVTFADKKLTLELTKLKASFAGTLADDGKTVKGEWKQSGLTFPLELKRVEKFSEVRRPQMPKKPYPYDEEEVVVENKTAGVKLSGTLTKPNGPGPFRAAILITGSGPQDRDESLANHKPFLVLADYLTRKGIAVLRCDDRGTGKSTGDHAKANSVDFAGDVRAQIAFLKELKDIREIGLIGHSEGGLIAPMVAVGNPDVAFIVLLAGPGFRGDEIMIMQGQALLKAGNADDKMLDWQRKMQTRIFQLLRDGAESKTIKAALEELVEQAPDASKKSAMLEAMVKQVEQVSSPWFKFFLSHDPRNDLKKVACPVLALNGAKDTQVPANENLGEIEKALNAAGNKNFTIREFANLNHLFQTCKTGLPDEYGKIEETMAPVVLESISDWIGKLK